MQFGRNSIITQDDSERVDFILKEFTNFRIPLQNKKIHLFKSLLIFCKKLDLEKDDFMGLKNEKFSIDTKTIIFFFLEKNVFDSEYLEDVDLVEYYRFFLRIGAYRQLQFIIKRIQNLKNFEDCFQLFVRLEEQFLQNLSVDPLNINVQKKVIVNNETFGNSLSLALFNRMKKLSHQLRKKRYLYQNPFFGIIDFLVGTNEKIPIYDHIDFEGEGCIGEKYCLTDLLNDLVTKSKTINEKYCFVDMEDFLTKLKTNEIADVPDLENVTNLHYNVTVFTFQRNHSFSCHVEILILRSNLFYRMFRSNWAEKELYRQKGEIVLYDVVAEANLDDIITFFYHEEFLNGELSFVDLVRMLVFSDLHDEKFLLTIIVENMERSLQKFKTVTYHTYYGAKKGYERKKIETEFRKMGYLLFNNENVIDIVHRIFGKALEKERMLELIKDSHERHQIVSLELSKELMIEKENQENELKETKQREKFLMKKNKELEEQIMILKQALENNNEAGE